MIKYFALIALAVIAQGSGALGTAILSLDVAPLTEFVMKNEQMVIFGWYGFMGACLVLQLLGDMIGHKRRKRAQQ